MPEFWLGTYRLAKKEPPSGSIAEPILSAGLETLAIEVIRDAAGEYAVLFSSADNATDATELQCRLGFANGAKACNVWRDRGFPLVDAHIAFDGNKTLTIHSPYFGAPGAMQYDSVLIRIEGVTFSSARPGKQLDRFYRQNQQAPDSAWPATWVRRRAVSWRPTRRHIAPQPPTELQFMVMEARSPSLRPLGSESYKMLEAWCGELDLPAKVGEVAKSTDRVNRRDAFGVPAFCFQDVEVLGFRIDIPKGSQADDQLRDLISPLNFHLDAADGESRPDFRYLPATRSLLVEVMRYGRMRLATQLAPLTMVDYQSQHELLVRTMVARVDDDASQGRDPAVFVPAIFVDNSWSKILGRDVQGFAKCMADFCVGAPGAYTRLRPDGRATDGAGNPEPNPRPMSELSRIALVDRTGAPPVAAMSLLDIECTQWGQGRSDSLEEVSAGEALGRFSLSDTRWGPADYEQLEYLGSFMRNAIRQLLHGFRSVQSSPVGAQQLDRAWITGNFGIDEVMRVGFPLGTARLTFRSPAHAPTGWKRVCDLLAARPVHELHTGRWYRLKFSMTMEIDDGLAWRT